LSGSTSILRGDGLMINFSVAQVVHIKSKDCDQYYYR
jgi:hypothetical protein